MGGLGSAVGELLIDRGGRVPKMFRLGLPDRFPERYGRQDDLLEFYGLQPEPIARSVSDFMAR
jgi:transketolase